MFIVLVYLGTRAPAYVYDNLSNLKKCFPDRKIVFISDSKESINRGKKIGIDCWLYDEDKLENDRLKESSSLPMGFRKGFWFSTTSRFFALAAFAKENPDSQILQFESDVWIAPNFPFIKFEELKPEIDVAFPLETQRTGAASVLYIRDSDAADLFALKVRQEMSTNKSATDMNILGNLYKSDDLRCLVLPTLPLNSKGMNPENDPEIQLLISEGTNYFGGVFDAVTYGLYLMGEDARNHRGKLYRYRRQDSHLVHCDKMKFHADSTGLYIEDGIRIPLYCLHIHSKSRKAWESNFLTGNLKKIVENDISIVRVSRDYLLTLRLVYLSLMRRIGQREKR